MVRENKVTLSFDNGEYEEIKKRAKEAHLSLATYCRHHLFDTNGHYVVGKTRQEAAIRLKVPKPPPDPYIIEKQKTHTTFKQEVQGQLFEALAKPNYLKKVSDEIKAEMKAHHESRKVIINKESKAIEVKNRDAGF
ncbi:unnamed protein product [marine sediment metagenome]|uniref:Uncharacterized protein n=1 Tax=marine sediment metagenome TaxID=412755 RepID=X1IDK0_9ZZZZ